MTPKILVLSDDVGFDRTSSDVLYNISGISAEDLYQMYNLERKDWDSFITWLVEKGYCANIPDEQIEYFYY